MQRLGMAAVLTSEPTQHPMGLDPPLYIPPARDECSLSRDRPNSLILAWDTGFFCLLDRGYFHSV
jgi:hypothetical protein